MKKRYILVGLLSAVLSAKAQSPGHSYVKQKLRSKEVSLLMSFYTQDNDHSAVTGGIGTEDLQVYATDLTMAWVKDSVHAIQLDGGVDIISSASTDNIDFVVSSASKEDARSHVNLAYDRFSRNGFEYGANGAFSIESDYTSYNVGAGVSRMSVDESHEWFVNVQAFFDDLRWGIFENGKPQKLVYPVELRHQQWFNEHTRNSLNVEMGWLQTINQRTVIGFYPGLVFQKGLLSTPFHRVYFLNGSKRVEKVPNSRIKISIGMEVNSFLGHAWILKGSYRFYWDDFGILAHTISLDVPYKVSRIWTIIPSVRYYTQSAAEFFEPYREHSVEESYYTSDYDLSKFESIKVGAAFRYAPFIIKKKRTFEEVEFRYNFYHRSDGLLAHMMSLYFVYSKRRT